MPREHTTNNKTYAANRRLLLKDNPVCHWCQTRAADTADHLTPYVLGGDDSLDNLVPACRSCNSSRGAKLGNQRRARGNPTTKSEPQPQPSGGINPVKPNNGNKFFLETHSEPPHAMFPISQKPPSVAKHGREFPRLETITPDHVESRATEILGFARDILGVELMPWQVRCLHGLTAYDENGDYLRRVGLTSVARQNGKTVVIAALIGWHLTVEGPRRGNPQLVISVAHKLDLAVTTFKYLAPILEEKFGAKVSWSYGRNELELHGHRWIVRAATPQAGHGYSADLITADEVWSISEAAIDEGLLPTQRARRNPLMAMFSTAGTQDSSAMLRWRSQGMRQIDAGEIGPMYFASYEPPPGLDPMTPEAWEYANPALGYTLDMSVLEAEAKAPNRAAFLRSSVNIWVAAANGWLEPGLFEACTTDEEIPAGGVLAIESSIDNANYVGVRAVQQHGITYVTVAFQVESLAAMWAAVDAEIVAAPTLKLALPPSLEIACPPKWERRRTIVGIRELGKWTAPVRSMILENRLRHSGEVSLVESSERAVMVKHNGAVMLSSARSPGPIELTRSMVFAAALASRPANVNKPSLVVVGR